LIIVVCCIFITLVASGILVPVTFALDTEQEDIVRKWMMISKSTKLEVLKNIDDFN